MTLVAVDFAEDPRLAPYRNIRDRDLLRAQEGRFVAETAVVVERLFARPDLLESVLVTPARSAWAVSLAPPESLVLVAPEPLIRGIAGFPVHRGVLAVGRRPPPASLTLDNAVPRRQGRLTVLVCEDITDPENIGLLFRNAAAFGVDAVLLSPACHDPYYRRALRVAVGHTFGMRWGWATPWPAALERLRDEWRVRIVGAAPGPASVPVRDAGAADRVAILVGSEHPGISVGALALCDQLVRVPMAPGVDSLNVGVAAAVILDRMSLGARI